MRAILLAGTCLLALSVSARAQNSWGIGGYGMTRAQQGALNAVQATANAAVPAADGDAGATRSTATGSTTARRLSDRDADVINVMDFGAKGDDKADDTAAINAAFAYARTLMSGKNGPYTQTQGPNAQIAFPSGHRWRINGSINATGFHSRNFQVRMTGSAIDCHAAGLVCWDALSNDENNYQDVNIVGDAVDMPLVGMQIGRIAQNITADNHAFTNLTIVGQFQFAALYDYAIETSSFLHPEIWNQGGNPGSYSLVMDNYAHAFTYSVGGVSKTFQVSSAFQNVTGPFETPSSSNEVSFFGADIRAGVGQTVPMWVGGNGRLAFYRSYAVGGGTSCSPTCYGAVIYNANGAYGTMYHFDIHFETTGLTDIFQFQGDNSQALFGFYYSDNGPQQTNSVIKLASNVTYLELRDAEFQIAGYQNGSTARFIDAPGLVHITGRYASNSNAQFNSTFFQGLVSFPGTQQIVNYGPGSLIGQYADGTATGGSARGNNAVDWQISRGAAGQVASGSTATIGGGRQNTASGQDSVVPGGAANTASGQGSSASGITSTASGRASIAYGDNSTTSGAASAVFGSWGNDQGNGSSLLLGGGIFSTSGDSQSGIHHLMGSGTGTGPIRLTAQGAAVSPTTCLRLSNSQSINMRIAVEATDVTSRGSDYSWTSPALVTQDGSVTTTAITLGTATVLSRGTVTGAAVSATADTTNGCVNISFSPPTANTTDVWHVVARLDTAEVR